MFDSIIFDLNPYFGYSTTFVYFSLHPPWACYAATALSGRRGALFFLWNRCTHLAAHSSKRLNPLSVIIIVCLGNAKKKQDCKTNCFINCSKCSHVVESQIALLVWPCLNHLQKNIAELITWSFLIIQSAIFTSAAFEAFADFNKCLQATFAQLSFENFWLYLLSARLFRLNFIKDYYKSLLKVCELKVWVM